MERREILTILSSASVFSLAGCLEDGGSADASDPDHPTSVREGTREIEFSLYVKTPYFQYFHEESEELRAVCPEGDWFVVPWIIVDNLSSNEQPMPRILDFRLDGDLPLDGFPGEVTWQDIDRRADGEDILVMVPGLLSSRSIRGGGIRSISPVYDVSGSVSAPVITWKGEHELDAHDGEASHGDPVEPSC